MITVKETLNVSAEAFFYQLLKSAAFDIRMATGKEVREKQLHKGYTYTKKLKSKMGRTGEVRVKITELKAPVIYTAEFTSASGKNIISYVIEPLEAEKITVTYTEDYQGETSSQNLNYRIIRVFYKRSARKKTARKLHSIEEYIRKG